VTATAETATQAGLDAEQASIEWADRLVKDADGDDIKLLELIREQQRILAMHAKRLRDTRDAAMVRLRETGLSNIDLAEPAGMSDSGVSRRVLKAGAQRRVNRRRGGLPDRRSGLPDRRTEGES
jgi:hypothetical protein